MNKQDKYIIAELDLMLKFHLDEDHKLLKFLRIMPPPQGGVVKQTCVLTKQVIDDCLTHDKRLQGLAEPVRHYYINASMYTPLKIALQDFEPAQKTEPKPSL